MHYIDYKKNNNKSKPFQKKMSTNLKLKDNAFFEWFQNKMMEIEDILLTFIVRMKNTIFSGFQ